MAHLLSSILAYVAQIAGFLIFAVAFVTLLTLIVTPAIYIIFGALMPVTIVSQ